MQNRPVVAQYTIRSKQQYIYATNRMREIEGASRAISGAFALLLQCARDLYGTGKVVSASPKDPHPLGRCFSNEAAQTALREGTLKVIELFCGGGNDMLLFAGEEVFLEVNRAFSYALQQKYPGMIPLAVCCDQQDYLRLTRKMSDEKSKMQPGRPLDTLPFALMDRTAWQPLAVKVPNNGERLSLESNAKRNARQEDAYKKAENAQGRAEGKYLDDLNTQHGVESLLAVVHADGNRMGVKIKNRLANATDYSTCVNQMRAFTRKTNDVFAVCGVQAMWDALDQLRQEHDLRASAFDFRPLIADGDDVTFVCNARLARGLTEAYLSAVQGYAEAHPDDTKETYSSCAGICIFHSHYPFARAYELAEQACDSAKRKAHSADEEQAWIDLHYIHSGVGGDLDDLRAPHGTGARMARPWRADAPTLHSLHTLDRLFALLKDNKVTRSNIKSVGNAYEVSTTDGVNELYRVYYRVPGLKEKLYRLFRPYVETDAEVEPAIMCTFYDLSEVYDLWYAQRTNEKEEG